MNIHEYQAKALLAKFAVPLLKGGVAYTKDEAMDVARKLASQVTVVKAQIHAGGRGKGGGVNLTFYGQGNKVIHADLVKPDDAKRIQAILTGRE